MGCPICGRARYIKVPLSWLGDCRPKNDRKLVRIAEPLYQRSYPGEAEYISPRCPICLDKAINNSKPV